MTTNIKFLIEGEEEVGSPNLGKFVADNKELLKADVILISDSSLLSMENPSLDIGVRGLSYIEVEVTAPTAICIAVLMVELLPTQSHSGKNDRQLS